MEAEILARELQISRGLGADVVLGGKVLNRGRKIQRAAAMLNDTNLIVVADFARLLRDHKVLRAGGFARADVLLSDLDAIQINLERIVRRQFMADFQIISQAIDRECRLLRRKPVITVLPILYQTARDIRQ